MNRYKAYLVVHGGLVLGCVGRHFLGKAGLAS